MDDIKDLPMHTRVMAPLGDVLHRGIVAEQSRSLRQIIPGRTEGTICVESGLLLDNGIAISMDGRGAWREAGKRLKWLAQP